jgi:hypothetical protein
MDDSLLKGSIEALNRLLAAINKLTDLPGVLGSASKAFLSFFTLFAGKKLFNVARKSLLPGLVGTFTGSGKKAGVSFSGAFMQEFKKTSLKMKTLKLGFNNTEVIKASKGVTAYTEATRRA